MSVKLRGSKFHYRFTIRGKSYAGVCKICAIPPGASAKEIAAAEKQALQFEAEERTRVLRSLQELKETEAAIRSNKTVRALIENYKFELTGGRPVRFDEAYDLAVAKPSKRATRSYYSSTRRVYWTDFAAFMAATYPEIQDISAVRRCHCEAYVSYLAQNGRYAQKVEYTSHRRKRPKTVSYERRYLLAPKTIKEIVGVCRWVFTRLEEDAGIVSDPWRNVVLPAAQPIDREVFTPHELRLIWEGIQVNDFCRPLFMIAANSGLTEGDICTLKWDSIDWASLYLRTRRRKTGVPIQLPIIPELAAYLQSLPRKGEYVLPEHAELYLRQSSLVSERVKAFLHGLGITTTVEIPGRRAVSVKDLHSMRHVFCYRAKRAGVPESVIMKFVGHAVLAMTQHYANHDTDDDLRLEMQKIRPLFLGEAAPESTLAQDPRQRLASLAYSLPLEVVERLLATLPTEDSRQLPLPA